MIGDPGLVVSGDDFGVVGIFWGDLEAETCGVTALPEVVVTDRAVDSKFGSIWAVAVIEFDASVEGRTVLNIQVNINRSGLHSWAENGSDSAIGPLVEGENIASDLIEIGDFALGDGRRLAFDLIEGKVAGTFDAEASDFGLGDLEEEDALASSLCGDGDGDGLEAFFVISAL